MYAGQQLTTGAQAQVYADHFIAVHVGKIAGGQTYSQLSTASIADPKNATLSAQVQTAFRGETLRGLLLNAYAFDTIATVAYLAALAALVGGAIMVLLVSLGFRHALQPHYHYPSDSK
jgi:hypothetical protein